MTEKPGSEPKKQKFCTSCGESLRPEFDFCPFCGEKRAVSPGRVVSGGKVTPISPEARKMLEEFDNQFEQLRRKRNDHITRGARSKEVDIKILIIIGSVILLFLLIASIYFSKQLSSLYSLGSGM